MPQVGELDSLRGAFYVVLTCDAGDDGSPVVTLEPRASEDLVARASDS